MNQQSLFRVKIRKVSHFLQLRIVIFTAFNIAAYCVMNKYIPNPTCAKLVENKVCAVLI